MTAQRPVVLILRWSLLIKIAFMFKQLLAFLIISLAFSSSLRAQESAASQTFKQRLRGQYLQSDTAQAIINLYSRRQAGGASWIMASALSAARAATASNQTTINGVVVREESNAGAALVLLPFVGYGVGKLVHYSNGHLEHILTDYAAGKPLARSLRRKLKRRFFTEPIIKYQPLPAQPAK